MLTASAKSARLWNVGTGQQLAELSHEDEVETVAFSPDGTRILTGSLDCTARLWDTASGKPLGGPLKHDQPVGAAIFSPDGTKILTGSGNDFLRTGEARLWDAATYRPLGEPLRHAGLIPAVAFSPQGTRLLTGSDDHTSRLWDAATCQPLGQPLQHEDEVVFVAFHPDGSKVFTGSGSITVRQWRIPITLPDDAGVVFPLVALVSGLYEESAGVLRPTTSEQREAYWSKLSENGSTWLRKWSQQDQRDVLQWHKLEASAEESHEGWFAAAFHLGYLIAHDPSDTELLHRRARAYAKLGQLDKAAADKLTPAKAGH